MERTLELGGFALAHALWSIGDGEELIPMVIWENGDGVRSLLRFASELLPEAVEEAHGWLEAPPPECARAAFVCDASATIDGEPTDALVLRAVAVGRASVEVVLAYRGAPGSISIESPRIGPGPGVDPSELPALADALLRGIAAHEQGHAAFEAARKRPG